MDPQERYEIKRRIEQSGVCVVYEGFDKQLQRKVAIKRLLSEDESGKDYEDLMRECQSLSALASANIVSLHDVGRDEDGPFMVLELLEGESLQKLIDKGPVELDDFYQIAEQTLEGLMAAHDIHLIHRDLKPSNINVYRRPSGRLQVKLQDFGLAKFSLEPSIRTIAHSNTLFGSIYYMAPEQFERQPLDNRTDIYSLGAVFYHMLSGQYPYDGDSGAQVMIGAMNGGATDLAELRPDLEPALCDWVMSMISKEADHRPLSCPKALEQLADIRNGVSAAPAPAVVAAVPDPTPIQAAPIPEPTGTAVATSTAQPELPAAPSNPMPTGPDMPVAQPAAAAMAHQQQPTVELAAAPHMQQPAHPGMVAAQQQQAAPTMGVPTQQMGMPAVHPQAIPAPQPTVQVITGGRQTPHPQAVQMSVPAPRITGPISGPMAPSSPIGGGALIGGARPGPLPKGSSFSAKQSSPFWWLWLVGAAAAIATIFLVVQVGPNKDQPNANSDSQVPVTTEVDNGSEASSSQPSSSNLAEALKLPAATEVFREQDKNGDFELSSKEFCAPASASGDLDLYSHYQKAFIYLDKNKDNRLVLSELYHAYRNVTF